MTYRELAAKIAALTPEQQDQQARFFEPYDNWTAFEIGGLSIVEGEPMTDENDDEFPIGTVFME